MTFNKLFFLISFFCTLNLNASNSVFPNLEGQYKYADRFEILSAKKIKIIYIKFFSNKQ